MPSSGHPRINFPPPPEGGGMMPPPSGGSVGANSGMPSSAPALEARQVTFAYPGALVLRGVSLAVERGSMVALLGPNASGKTTLLRLLGGALQPQEGEVLLNTVALKGLRRREIARQVAVVPQQFTMPFAFTAQEVVMMGRTPYLRPLSGPGPADQEAVTEALETMGMAPLADRFFNDLSGGERQKVVVAMALAQGPQVLLLDEPTAHLDIHAQMEILDRVKRLNQEGLTVVAAMHDLNLAALYFPRLVLLHRCTVEAQGTPQEVLTRERLQTVYGAQVALHAHPTLGVPQVTLLPQDGWVGR